MQWVEEESSEAAELMLASTLRNTFLWVADTGK